MGALERMITKCVNFVKALEQLCIEHDVALFSYDNQDEGSLVVVENLKNNPWVDSPLELLTFVDDTSV